MILFDTEATALHNFTLAPPDQQPELLEFYAVKYKGERVAGPSKVLTFQCKPRTTLLNPEVTKITGLTLKDVAKAKSFAAYYPALVDFFLGERTVVAHNLPYDLGVLRHELGRIDKVTAFPWPPRQLCTVEQSAHLSPTKKFLSLKELYLLLFKKELKQEHRAGSDTQALCAIVAELQRRGEWPESEAA